MWACSTARLKIALIPLEKVSCSSETQKGNNCHWPSNGCPVRESNQVNVDLVHTRAKAVDLRDGVICQARLSTTSNASE